MIKMSTRITISYAMPVFIFVAFSLSWVFLQAFDVTVVREARLIWSTTYQIMALYGVIVGILISYKWGGHRSILGKAILAFSVGLFLQCFGQGYSSYYVYRYAAESPSYPGIGDIGFFGSVLAYIYGVFLMYNVSGARFSLKGIQHKIWAFLVPALMLLFSYAFFLQNYTFDFTDNLKIFLDFGYPFGQALYVSIALLVLLSSRKFLGGLMKRPILFLISALIFQYISDFMFLYQANNGTFIVAGTNDYSYCVSYFLMTIGLVYLGNAFNKIKAG